MNHLSEREPAPPASPAGPSCPPAECWRARPCGAPVGFISSSRSFLCSQFSWSEIRNPFLASQACFSAPHRPTKHATDRPRPTSSSVSAKEETIRRQGAGGRRPPGRRRRCRAEGKQRGRGGATEAHHRRRTASVAAARPLARRAQTERASLLDDDGAVGSGRGLCLFHFWSCAGGRRRTGRARARERGRVR